MTYGPWKGPGHMHAPPQRGSTPIDLSVPTLFFPVRQQKIPLISHVRPSPYIFINTNKNFCIADCRGVPKRVPEYVTRLACVAMPIRHVRRLLHFKEKFKKSLSSPKKSKIFNMIENDMWEINRWKQYIKERIYICPWRARYCIHLNIGPSLFAVLQYN